MKLNKDYKYAYPLGLVEGPVITIKTGPYEGLILHLESSHINDTQRTQLYEDFRIKLEESHIEAIEQQTKSLHFTYNIRKMWRTYDAEILTITQEDQKFIYDLITNFINETN